MEINCFWYASMTLFIMASTCFTTLLFLCPSLCDRLRFRRPWILQSFFFFMFFHQRFIFHYHITNEWGPPTWEGSLIKMDACLHVRQHWWLFCWFLPFSREYIQYVFQHIFETNTCSAANWTNGLTSNCLLKLVITQALKFVLLILIWIYVHKTSENWGPSERGSIHSLSIASAVFSTLS